MDQFVCGIRNGNSLKKLLSQDKDWCLFNIAIADEASEKESKSLNSYDSINYTNMHRIIIEIQEIRWEINWNVFVVVQKLILLTNGRWKIQE